MYRFSPITSKEQLFDALHHVHVASHQLAKKTFGTCPQNAGNIATFSHYENEYEYLKTLRNDLCEPAVKEDQKYFKLKEPMTFEAEEEIPAATYTYLYIRQPDPYRSQVGDIDFYMPPDEYVSTKEKVTSGELLDARIFPRDDFDMIELYHPDSDVLAYVTPLTMEEKVL